MIIRVNSTASRRGLGQFVLADVFASCVKVADTIGAALIVLDAINEDAERLYRCHGLTICPRQAKSSEC